MKERGKVIETKVIDEKQQNEANVIETKVINEKYEGHKREVIVMD